MTTIATDGKIVCCDSRRASGHEIIDNSTKKLLVRSNMVFGCTGDFGPFRAAIDWYIGGAQPQFFPREGKEPDCNLHVFRPDGIWRFSAAQPYGDQYAYPNAFGSGSSYALGALYAGASPREAIEVASTLDAFTGGPIQTIDLRATWGMDATREAAE